MTLKNGKDYKFYLSPAKEKLAAAEAKVYAVGVGKYVNEEALNFMASVPTASHVFKIGNGKSLAEKVLSESEMPCRPMDNEVDSGMMYHKRFDLHTESKSSLLKIYNFHVICIM